MTTGPDHPAEQRYHESGAERDLRRLPRQRTSRGPRRPSRSASLARTVIEAAVIIAAAVVIAMLVQAFLVKPFTIHQVSMRPTLEEGDRILINRLAYRFGDPSRGDIVVLHSPVNPDEDLVKRIVAVAGDTVAVSDGAPLPERGGARRALSARGVHPGRHARDGGPRGGGVRDGRQSQQQRRQPGCSGRSAWTRS